MTINFTYIALILILSVIVVLVDNANSSFAKSEVFVNTCDRAMYK